MMRQLGRYYQHVKGNKSGEAILDHCYTKVKDVSIFRSLPRLGKADHNLILLCPKYIPLVKRRKKRMITVKNMTKNAIERLKDSLETTDWAVLKIVPQTLMNLLSPSVGTFLK